MKKETEKSLRTAGIVLFLLVYACFARAAAKRIDAYVVPETIFLLSRNLVHTGLLLVWAVSIKRRIMQKSVVRYLLGMAILMIFWMYIRTSKWMFFNGLNRIVRYLWYAYYIPMILIPLFGVFLVQYIGKPEDYEIPKRMKLFYLPACILIGLVLTNDIHRLAFDFPLGIRDFNTYTYHIVYYLVVVWMVSLGVYFVVMMMIKCRAPGRQWFQKLPLLVFGGAVIAWAVYYLRIMDYDMVAVNCLLVALLLESSIRSGMIRSNSKYQSLFQASTIEAQIVDSGYRVKYVSETAWPLEKKTMQQAEREEVELGDRRLSGAKISHGWVFWCDNVAEINRYTKALEKTGEQMEEKNALLQAELKLREEHLRIMEENRIYDHIVKEMSGQLQQLESLLKEAKQTEETEKKLARICMISVFVKRCSNLMLLSESTPDIPARELELCLRESLEYIRLSGTLCSMDSECEGIAPARTLAAVYQMFERVAEQAVPRTGALLVKLKISGEQIFLRLLLDDLDLLLPEETTDWTDAGGKIAVKKMEETMWIEMEASNRGGNI